MSNNGVARKTAVWNVFSTYHIPILFRLSMPTTNEELGASNIQNDNAILIFTIS